MSVTAEIFPICTKVTRKMLPGQMSPCQLESVLDVPKNLSLKFDQIKSVTAEKWLTLRLFGSWVRSIISVFTEVRQS